MFKDLRLLFNKSKQDGAKGIFLARRLYLFLTLLVTSILAMVLILIFAFGLSNGGVKEAQTYFQNELKGISNDISETYGNLGQRSVTLAEKIATNVDTYLKENQISDKNLQNNPSILYTLLSNEFQSLKNVIESSETSGSFLLFNATVNPALSGSEYSRAGIFLKRINANSFPSVITDIRYLRGPAQIARDNGVELLGQWSQEFETENEPFWNNVMNVAKENSALKISRLFMWTDRILLKGNSESAMLCIVPIRGSDGTIYGVCGTEISAMMFKGKFSPTNTEYLNIFTVFSKIVENSAELSSGLLAGNSYLSEMHPTKNAEISIGRHDFSEYSISDTETYAGLTQNIKLYSDDSPYAEQINAVAVLMPKAELETIFRGNNNYFYISLALLLGASLFAAFFVSRHYLQPVLKAIKQIKEREYVGGSNKYIEINDLMDFLSTRDLENEKNNSKKEKPVYTPYMFTEFTNNIKTLSPAEKAVFDLYLEGYTAQEIVGKLFLSINTIKTHNRRIFAKLNVESRKELMVYINMMREMNGESK